MLLTEVYKSKESKHVAFAFGRMNPPTIGHALLMNTVARAAKGGDYLIYLSQTQDGKNPLSYAEKIEFIKRMFPQHANHIVYAPGIKTPIHAMRTLYEMGYTDVTMVAGDDRLADYKQILTHYNNTPDHWSFNTIKMVSSGPRDGDSEVSNVSASKARDAAKKGKFELFQQITGTKGRLAEKLYRAVREGLGKLSEDVAGVGVVAKNKKMAREPRYSTSMTVDVHPDTPQKNLRAFKLA